MQLKIKRSQKSSMMGAVVFCLDARLELTRQEAEDIKKYKLGPQVIYSSEDAKRHATAALAPRSYTDRADWDVGSRILDGASQRVFGAISSIGHAALARMSLTITFNSLQNGQHIECKALDEVMATVDALIEACNAARAYLQTAATFDGREAVIDFSDETPKLAHV